MAVYLVNNKKYYIAHSQSGAVIKVKNIEDAQDFHTVENALEQKRKAPGKTKGYSIKKKYNPSDKVCIRRRKNFSKEERMDIYKKTRGYCYLCGEFVDYDKFEIEHRIPLAGGGTNDISNLYCSCHTCNTLKGSIAPKDLLRKVKQIYLYQLKNECNSTLKFKVISGVLERFI